MKHVLKALLKLFLIYCILAIVCEVAIAHYIAIQINFLTHQPHEYINTSISALCALTTKITSFNLQQVKLVELSLWVFRNRIYYCFIILAGLALYYTYKEKTLVPPNITKRSMLPDYQFDEHKRKNTKEEVRKLKQTKEYIDWANEKNKFKWSPPTDNGIDWNQGEQEIYDQ